MTDLTDEQIKSLTRRVDELQGTVVGLRTALLLSLNILASHASKTQNQLLQEATLSLQKGLRQSGDFYAEHASATVIPDAHIEHAQRTLNDLASVMKPSDHPPPV